jgi:hypothetical protein
MKAVFVELPAFGRHRAEYLDDEGFSALQRKALKAMIKAELDSRRTT